jgi:amino acid transporter
MFILSRNKRFIKENQRKKSKITALLAVLFAGLILLFILMFSPNKKARFLGDIICFSFIAILIFIIGVCLIISRPSKDDKLSDIVRIKGFGTVCLFISILLSIYSLLDYYKDVPKVINSNYSSYEGKLTKLYVHYGRATSTTFIIGDKEFKVTGKFTTNPPIIGNKYHVEFLPNTKFVMSLKGIEIKSYVPRNVLPNSYLTPEQRFKFKLPPVIK